MLNTLRPPVARLLDVAREMAGASLAVVSDGLEDLAYLVRSRPLPPPVLGEVCGDVSSSPDLRLLAAVREQRLAEPPASVLVASTVWVPAFASEVEVGRLLALDGGLGRRAMRVTRLRRSERSQGFGASVEVVTFLLVDAESGEPGSVTVAVDEPLTVAAEVPGTVPADFADGAA